MSMISYTKYLFWKVCMVLMFLRTFSETWLNSSLAIDSIVITGYSYPLMKDRVGKYGGGVALYDKDRLAIKRRVEFEYSAGLELLWIQRQCR